MSIVGLPLILFKVGVGGIATFLSDHLVLEVKDFLGKRVDIVQETTQVSGTTTETTIASHISNTDKDTYFVQMIDISVIVDNTSTFTLRLYVNNVLREQDLFAFSSTAAESSLGITFSSKDLKFTDGQEFKITAQNNSAGDDNTFTTNALLYEEDTDANPLADFQ